MKVTVRLTVLKDKPYVKTPHFTARSPHASTEEFYCTTGVDAGKRDLPERTSCPSREARVRDHRDRLVPIGGALVDRDAVTRLA